MVTVAATELNDKLGQVIDQARREPVLVQNHGRDVVVILAHTEYDRLRKIEAADKASQASNRNSRASFLLSLAGIYDSGFPDTSEQVHAVVDQVLQLKFGRSAQ